MSALLAYKKGQPCIGSALVDLNFENQAARAQFNLNYDFSNGTNGITYSAKFDTSYNETVEPVTWSPTTSNSALPNGTTAQTTVVSFLLTASTSPNSGPTISSLASSTASSRHSKDARIIGSTLGVLLALALFVLAACLVCMRKSRSLIRVLQEKDMARGSTREGTVVDDGTPIGTPIAPLEYLRELPVQDGPRELSGGGGGGRHELSESRQ